jgi:hypothetical protein
VVAKELDRPKISVELDLETAKRRGVSKSAEQIWLRSLAEELMSAHAKTVSASSWQLEVLNPMRST